ncbi:MAG: hypothetical protein ACRC4L_01215 [Mycoplasma sp.]
MFLKKIPKIVFAVTGTALLCTGIGFTSWGGVQISSTKEDSVVYHEDISGLNWNIGTGWNNYLIDYFNGVPSVTIKGEKIEYPNQEQIKEYRQLIMGGNKFSKFIKDIIYFYENVEKDKDFAEIQLPQFRSMLKNYNSKNWGIALVVLGPVMIIGGGSSLAYGFMKQKEIE